MITGVPGSAAICRAADRPSSPGISMSRKTASGRDRRHISIARWPSLTTATTSYPKRFQLILQSDRDWFFVVRDQNTIRPSHRHIPSGHNQGDEDLITQIVCRFIEISEPLAKFYGKHASRHRITAANQASVAHSCVIMGARITE